MYRYNKLCVGCCRHLVHVQIQQAVCGMVTRSMNKTRELKVWRMRYLYSLYWLLVLLFVAWPVGYVCASLFVLISPLHAVVSELGSLVNMLKEGMGLPYRVALNAVNGTRVTALQSVD
ncbi:uncharacterized protein LOC131953891 [Physella acuta]|uniref:uncharacterized protein LOC131953891 n=1 Tax=Physella acuta TaxID=109671 RepID=UPI0027DB527D|nr:uncharacterized protein LOC131953891 [Physella acuta]